jgi:hypothetical protein
MSDSEVINLLVQQNNAILIKLENVSSQLADIKMKRAKKVSVEFEREYFTAKEVCKILDVTTRTLQNYRDANLLIFFKRNERIFHYEKTSVFQLLKQ